MIELDVRFIKQTKDAILVTDGAVEAWLPKSQIIFHQDSYMRGDPIPIDAPKWLADEKNLSPKKESIERNNQMDQMEGRDLVLPNNSYAHVLDETKGNIICYVGPSKTQLADTDKLVVFDDQAKTYKHTTRSVAVRQIHVAPEGWYTILKNPAKDNKQPQPSSNETISIDRLNVGRKVHIPGPVSFPLWPGQMAQVVQGHRLRSNQYLIVRVYDADAAKENWKNTIIQKTSVVETEVPKLPGLDILPGLDKADLPQVDLKEDSAEDSAEHITPPDPVLVDSILDEDIEFTVGKLMIVNGTDVSFFIPPTGIEVVKDDDGSYTRDAVTLERLTYCILLDENGSKRYVRGPAVVFPLPTEVFQTQRKGNVRTRKFRAIELNEISGIYIKVIAPYTEAGRNYKEGEELFITGKEQAIYYRRDEHQIVRYGETEVHYATAIPKGEARYVLQRLTGKIKTIKGPEMLLPDPRTEVIVRRVLPLDKIALMYPGNKDALKYNAHLESLTDDPTDFVTDNQYSFSACDDETLYGDMVGRSSEVTASAKLGSTSEAYTSMMSDTGILNKKASYTKPRTVTLDTKYDGAVRIQVWTGYAVIIVDGVGNRRVIEGPATYNLEYDEYPEKIVMSTGKPKTTDHLKEDIYLRTKNNKVADIITVETKDLVRVSMKLSYKINFVDESAKWFDVENYVKYLCDHMRSRLKGFAQTISLNDFYSDSVNKIRDVVLGSVTEGKERGTLFSENNMFVADVEVLKVSIEDREIAHDIINTQQEIVSTTISTARKSELLELKKRLYKLEAEERKLEIEATADRSEQYHHKLSMDMEDAQARHELEMVSNELDVSKQVSVHEADMSLDKARLQHEQTQQVAKDEFEVRRQESLDLVNQSKLSRHTAMREADISHASKENELRQGMITTQSKATVDQMKAVQPGLVEALQANNLINVTSEIMPSAIPLSIVEGQSVSYTLDKLFKGTSIGNVLHNMTSNTEDK